MKASDVIDVRKQLVAMGVTDDALIRDVIRARIARSAEMTVARIEREREAKRIAAVAKRERKASARVRQVGLSARTDVIAMGRALPQIGAW